MEIWQYANKNPITTEAYWHRMDTGTWADNDAGAGASPEIDPEQDPAGSLKAEIAAAKAGLDAYKAIDSDEQAARAQTLRAALTALSGKADKARATEKAPHLQAGKDIDAKWQPLVRDAAVAANTLREAMQAWEDYKRESLRRAEVSSAISKIPVEPNTPPPASQIKGATGRTASVRIKKVVTAIDLQKAWEQFGGQPEVYNLLLELAQKATDAGIVVPGATIEEKSDIR
jgi:hypothetical protein